AFSKFIQVSRETITSLIKYENYLIKSNKTLNLIGKSTINEIWLRHFLDSSQVIDFIDKNTGSLIDLGSGAGFPGLIIAILAKDRKINLKVKLIEKSPKKASFLREIVNYLNLNVEVLNINALTHAKKLEADLIVARAFKPLKIILQFLDKNTENWKKVFLFLGKTGQDELLQASKNWHIKYKQRMSVTSNDSIVIEINKLTKK
ncbi:MAG: 16S rRNA (guanine(527)-N(7))-methyltransferase RsmG, partial [Alphaproteobacteria bacterium]